MKRKMYRQFCVALVLAALLLAGGRVGAAHIVPTLKMVQTDTSAQEGLPLPSVPSALRTVPERAAYVLAHFWDGMDFRDTLRSRNRAFMEQNFVNFLSLFPHAEQAAVAVAVKKLLKAAETDIPAYMLLTEMAEKYLCDPESPMASEGHYMLFLEEMVQTPVLDEYGKTIPRYQLEAIRKNAPGTPAGDFTFLTTDGKRQTLYETAGERLLLFFMDPDCAHCRETMAALEENECVRHCLGEKQLTIWVIDVSGNRVMWQYNRQELPDFWNSGFDTDGIREQNLYVWRSLPAFYLLDNNKKVLLKEPSLQMLTDFLTALCGKN